jgi:hypothetical protein
MGMDAMEEALAKKKIERARIDGQRTKTSQSNASGFAISVEKLKSFCLTSPKASHYTKAKPTTAETMSPAVKSIMICDGPPSRLIKIDGRSHRDGKFALSGGGGRSFYIVVRWTHCNRVSAGYIWGEPNGDIDWSGANSATPQDRGRGRKGESSFFR